jgi:hypothetical protein
VSQISPPIRIVLIGAFVFLAAWFTVLKPKSDPIEPVASAATPAATPQTAYGKAVAKAKAVAGKAVATATPAVAATATATPAPAAEPAVAVPAETLAKLPKRVATALQERKILVLGVFDDTATAWRSMADDDRYTRNALRRVNRYDGDVVVATTGISDLSTYGPLVNDLGVKQSPSIVVIDRELNGRVLTGYTDRISINQTIADARDATTTPLVSDPYLRELNDYCGDRKLRFGRLSYPTVKGKKPLQAAMNRAIALGRAYQRKLRATDAPAQWRPLKAQFLQAVTADVDTATVMMRLIKHNDLKGAKRAYNDLDRSLGRKIDRRFNDVGLTNCAYNRRS